MVTLHMKISVPGVLTEAIAKVKDAMPFQGKGVPPVNQLRQEPDLEPNLMAVPPLAYSAPDNGPWMVNEWAEGRIVLQSDDFNHDVALHIDGDFADYSEKMDYARRLANWLNERLRQDVTLGLAVAHRAPVAPYEVATPPAPLAAVEEPAEGVAPSAEAVQDVEPAVAPPLEELTAPAVTRTRRNVETQLLAELSEAAENTPVATEPASVAIQEVPPPLVLAPPARARYGCHCELPPGEEPGPCVIDLNRRDCCGHAMRGIRREQCEFWQPITLTR